MNDLLILKWNLKSDLHAWNCVFGVLRDQGALFTIASLLYHSGICQNITITDVFGTFHRDWSSGVAKTSTQLFNEQLSEVLGDKHDL